MSRFVRWAIALAMVAAGLAAAPAGAARTAGPPSGSDLTTVVPVYWNNQLWLGRMSPVLKQGPAPNYWIGTPPAVYTDSQDRLHLVAEHIGDNFYSAGVTSDESDFGYGTYRFVVDSHIGDLDPIAVVGMFTFNRNVRPGNEEIDVELSRWGQPSPTFDNSQFVVQPWKLRGHLRHFFAPTDHAPLTYEWNWTPTAVYFRLLDGDGPNAPVLKRWKSAASPVPASGTRIYLNLWFFRGQPPYDGKSQEVIFRSFDYTPAPS